MSENTRTRLNMVEHRQGKGQDKARNDRNKCRNVQKRVSKGRRNFPFWKVEKSHLCFDVELFSDNNLKVKASRYSICTTGTLFGSLGVGRFRGIGAASWRSGGPFQTSRGARGVSEGVGPRLFAFAFFVQVCSCSFYGKAPPVVFCCYRAYFYILRAWPPICLCILLVFPRFSSCLIGFSGCFVDLYFFV